LIAAAAALAGRDAPTLADLWPIIFTLPTLDAQRAGRDVLRDLLMPTENGSLLAAAAEASLGPLARAAKILKDGVAILDRKPEGGSEEAWRLSVEGVAREIDATFAKEALPEALSLLRQRIVAVLAPATHPPASAE